MQTKNVRKTTVRKVLAGAAVLGLSSTAWLQSQAVAQHSVPKDDIVDTAVKAGQFKTLVKAVQAAGLAETLKGKGPFTVFAPTDAAFAKLPRGTVEALLNDRAKLTAILTYHVVPGRLPASRVVNTPYVFPVNKKPLYIQMRNGKPAIGNATIVKTDIKTSNGVIHVIDSVLMPPM
jgi:transforming growth factor-beta-induced protein